MRAAVLLLLLPAVGAATPESGQSAWTYVPASVETRTWGAFDIARLPADGLVTLLRSSPGTAAAEPSPTRVFMVDLPPQSMGSGGGQLERLADFTVPRGARWPDANGRIDLGPATFTGQQVASVRNPWEVRVHADPVSTDTLFFCGAILTGGDAGPVAILNNRVVKPGDFVGKFSVAGILAEGVILERAGSYFVIPRAKRTTVATLDG